jgi:hypothetical protein
MPVRQIESEPLLCTAPGDQPIGPLSLSRNLSETPGASKNLAERQKIVL